MYINKIELYANGELLDSSHDRKILSQIPLRDKTVIIAKVNILTCFLAILLDYLFQILLILFTLIFFCFLLRDVYIKKFT